MPSEPQYTAAEVRMMASRRACEETKHRPEPELMAANFGFWGIVSPPELYPTDRQFECSQCDAVVTIKYPPLGRSSDAPQCGPDL